MAVVSSKSYLGDVVGVHPCLVVARTQVELGEEANPVLAEALAMLFLLLHRCEMAKRAGG